MHSHGYSFRHTLSVPILSLSTGEYKVLGPETWATWATPTHPDSREYEDGCMPLQQNPGSRVLRPVPPRVANSVSGSPEGNRQGYNQRVAGNPAKGGELFGRSPRISLCGGCSSGRQSRLGGLFAITNAPVARPTGKEGLERVVCPNPSRRRAWRPQKSSASRSR